MLETVGVVLDLLCVVQWVVATFGVCDPCVSVRGSHKLMRNL